jgi:hypothetical protein
MIQGRVPDHEDRRLLARILVRLVYRGFTKKEESGAATVGMRDAKKRACHLITKGRQRLEVIKCKIDGPNRYTHRLKRFSMRFEPYTSQRRCQQWVSVPSDHGKSTSMKAIASSTL